MATKEDILEQIVEDYLIHQGYFVRHNIKFLPRKEHGDSEVKKDSNHSDIDVIGFHPTKTGKEKVIVVSCKSWQWGFSPVMELNAIKGDKPRGGRVAWKNFRELAEPKWSEGFMDAVLEATGTEDFTYVTAVTRLRGRGEDKNRKIWEEEERFKKALKGNPVVIWTLEKMITEIMGSLTRTLAATEVGRMIQLFAAAELLDPSLRKSHNPPS